MRYYLNVVLLNKKRWIPFLICLVLPFLYMIRSSFDDPIGVMTLNKSLLLFQNDGIPSGYQYQIPYNWYMCIYILILICDFGIEMKKKSYNELLIVKNSLKKSQQNQTKAMFLIPFFLIIITLGINFIVTFLFFGSYDAITKFDVDNQYSYLLVTYPIIFSIFSIIFEGLLVGFLGVTANNFAKILTQKKQIYLALFLFWYVLIMMPEKLTIFNWTQIFSQTSFVNLITSLVFTVSYFVMINIILLIISQKKEKYE